jgi:cobalt-zinc-cadmium efflux system protein
LLFDGVPQGVNLPEVQTYLQALPGVAGVHDLHIWALGTSEVALTAHLLMPDGHPGDDFLTRMAATLHEKFDIDHPTVQIETQAAAECGCHQHFGEDHA